MKEKYHLTQVPVANFKPPESAIDKFEFHKNKTAKDTSNISKSKDSINSEGIYEEIPDKYKSQARYCDNCDEIFNLADKYCVHCGDRLLKIQCEFIITGDML